MYIVSAFLQHDKRQKSTSTLSFMQRSNAQPGLAGVGLRPQGTLGLTFCALRAANPSVCLPDQFRQWFDWLPCASAFPLSSSWRGEKSCLHLPFPVLWMFIVLSAWELQLLPASLRRAEQRAVLRAFPLSVSSGPAHLLSCWVGSCRRSPLSFKIKHAELLACLFPLHSWSFTFVSEVTFYFSLYFPATTPRLSLSLYIIYIIHFFLQFLLE